jgi:hypothetical protein
MKKIIEEKAATYNNRLKILSSNKIDDFNENVKKECHNSKMLNQVKTIDKQSKSKNSQK